MCSSCGGKAAAARLPGGSPRTPLVIGAADDSPPQPVTLTDDIPPQKSGAFVYVTGDGVGQALEDGRLIPGYNPPKRATRISPSGTPPFFVQTAPDKWVGFRNKPAADLYARSVGGTVITRAELEGS